MELVQKTIGRMLSDISAANPQREALVHTEAGVRYNYSLLSWEVSRLARSLLISGIRRGDRVGLWAPNIPEWVVSFLALAHMGGVTVPVDPGASRDELLYVLKQSECRALILLKGLEGDEYVPMALHARDQCPELEHLYVIADATYPDTTPWAELMARGEQMEEAALARAADQVRPRDTVAIMYTSGTTGPPKGVVLDHVGLINKSLCSLERQGVTREDRLALFFPLYHMFGNTCIALAGLLGGAALILPSQTFDPPRILRAIDQEACTAIYASPSMLIGLLDHPEFQPKRWKTLKKGIVGGAPCPMELMKRLVEELGVSRVTVGYGITEASSWITMTLPEDPVELRVSTIGTPLPCNEVKIVDPRSGEAVPAGSQGEICTRGCLMKGYHQMPAATAGAVDRDGWFHTGDVGTMDKRGYVRITGRLKDVIVRDGVEIHPVEVEEILYRLPGISEVQVFGFPHPEKGQEVAAWIKVKEGASISLVNVAAHLRDALGPEKTVQYFKIVPGFPMTRSGKVQKFKLAERAQAEYEESGIRITG